MGAIGGLGGNFPTLESVANLSRALINDDKNNGAGIILTDQSTTLVNLMNSAIRETYRDCRIMGDKALIRDGYFILGVPPINSALGVGVANPMATQSIQFVGVNDGLEFIPNLNGLPSDLILPLELFARRSGTEEDFRPLKEAPGALSSIHQTVSHGGEWEWRGNSIYLHGSLLPMDYRIRYLATFIDLAAMGVSFPNTSIPISDCAETVADKIVLRYSRRLGSTESQNMIADLIQQSDRSTTRLRQQVCRSQQRISYLMKPFGGGGTALGRAQQYLF